VTSKPDFKVMVLLLVFMQLTRDLFAIAKFLLLCVSTLTRDIDIAIMSVRPSVRDTLVLYENGLTHRHSFYTVR